MFWLGVVGGGRRVNGKRAAEVSSRLAVGALVRSPSDADGANNWEGMIKLCVGSSLFAGV